jgi:uncharacterized protein YecT (DUF1311 family)
MDRAERVLRITVLLALSLLAIAPSYAQHMNEKDSPCANVGPTSDLVQCWSKARDASDAEMNSVYQSLLKRLDASDRERLTIVQRHWILYRDTNCSAAWALYGGGTGGPPEHLACLERMTRARAKELHVTYAVKLKD